MKETFEQLLENNKAKIYRICKIYAVSPLEPQDLFQEVIFAIWKSLPTFKGNSSVDTWIYRITLNICLRSKQKSEKTSNKTLQLESIQFIPVEVPIENNQQEKYNALTSVAMGGRIAEEIIFGHDKVTSGASSDIEMVQKWQKIWLLDGA